MKKILLMAVSAALLAAGCQKTEIQNEVRTPIGFNTQMGKLTKAGPDAENSGLYDNLVAQGFRVWGYFATQGDINYAYHEYYFDEIIEVTGTSEPVTGEDGTETTSYNWSTGDKTYYWPGKEKELDIYAISSWKDNYDLTAEGNVTITHATDETPAKVEIKDFVVTPDADNDLMVAALIRQDQDDDKFIRPHFEHALTKVVLNFQSYGGSEVYVISATTSEINSKATLSVTNTEPAETDGNSTKKSVATFSWGEQSEAQSYNAQCKVTSETVSDVIKEDGTTGSYEAVKLNTEEFITFGSWLLLPQEKDEKITDPLENHYLDVKFIVDKMYVEQRFMLKVDNKVTEWKRNQLTTYNVTISPDYIQFDPDVKEWADTIEDVFEN